MGIVTVAKAIEKAGLPRSTFQRKVKQLSIPTVNKAGKIFFEEAILEKYFPSQSKGLGKVISFANQKGGIGKTTTCLNLAIAFSRLENKEENKKSENECLVIDMDPQANLSGQFIKDTEELTNTIANLLDLKTHGFHNAKFENTVIKTEYFDLLPSNISLANFDIARDITDYDKLDIFLKTIKGAYSYVFIDCPPTLDIKLLNSIVASDYVIIPNTPSKFSVQGLSFLKNTIEKAKTKNVNIKAFSIVNQYVPQHQIAAMTKRIEDYFPVLKTKIPRKTDIEKSQVTDSHLDKFSPSAFLPYMNLAKEVIELCQS